MISLRNYDEAINIPLNSSIKFQQFTLLMNEKKHLQYTVSGLLFSIISPEDSLDSEMIKTYYKGVDEQFFPQLSQYAFTRLVIQVGEDANGMPQYVTVHLNKYYMMVGLQLVEYEEYIPPQPEIPVNILGFNSYELGNKFKH